MTGNATGLVYPANLSGPDRSWQLSGRIDLGAKGGRHRWRKVICRPTGRRPGPALPAPIMLVGKIRLSETTQLFQIIRNSFREQNVASICAVHHPLGHVDSGTSYVGLFI